MTGLAMKWLIGASSMVAAVATPLPALAYEAGAVAGGGSITGKVVFNGTPGTRKVIPTKDIEVCGGPYEETLIQVGPDKSVQNAVVYLTDIAKGKAWPAGSQEAGNRQQEVQIRTQHSGDTRGRAGRRQ